MHHRTTPSLAVVNQVISHMARPSLAGFRSTNNLAITQEMIRRLDLGQDMAKLKFVHIAGTKGKGSTSFATAKLLQRAGLRVGLFTSPHLVDVRERCLINGEMLDKDIFSKAFLEFQETHDRAFEKEEWAPEEQGGTLPQKTSFFRFMFLFAIRMFAEQAVDVVVLEVGVGGRLDSTNAVTPVVCGITALGMDHMDILGNTIESIAFEKAGIAKSGVPLFTSCQRDYPQTLDVISKQTAEVKAPMTIIQDNWYETVDWSSVRQRGDHMVENCKLAVALSRTALGRDVHEAVTKEELEVLANSAYPGRSHVVPHPVGRAKFYLDGAHTPESMRVAAKWFFEAAARDGLLTPGRPRAVLLFFSSRDNRKLLSAFVPYAQHIHKIVFVTFPHDSSQLPNTGTEHLYKAQEAWRSLVAEHQSTHPQLADVQAVVKEEPLTSVTHLADVVDEGAASSDLVPTLCTGSLYLIGAVLQTLQSTPS